MLTVNELFAGIGAFRKALIRLGIPHRIKMTSFTLRLTLLSLL